MKKWWRIRLVFGLVMGLIILAGIRSWMEIRKWDDNISINTTKILASPTVVVLPTMRPLKSVLLDVPFTSQAPNGEWSDPRHQDGCEEASILMVWCFFNIEECEVNNGKIAKKFAKEEILKMSHYQENNFGSYVDTSGKDTGFRMLASYYGSDSFAVMNLKSWEEIVEVIMNGAIVIVPMDGRKLLNPYFTYPGPERHMLVVKGFDLEKKEFITNDPGTRSGENYRYPVDLFWEAIGDYPTGNHELILEREKKMIAVFNWE